MQNLYLTELREERGLSQAELAYQLKLSPSTLSSYEQGTRNPRDSIKVRIAEFFGVSVLELFYRNFDKSKSS